MMPVLISLLLVDLSTATSLPEVMSYAKVSRNGQEEKDSSNDQTSWITRMIYPSNGTQDEGRSIKHIAITMSPVYIAPKIPKLQNGEAANYSPVRYSTLDHEMIAKLNSKKTIQDRYHPPSIISFKNRGPANDAKQVSRPIRPPSGPPNGPPSGPPNASPIGPPMGPPSGPSDDSPSGPPSGPPDDSPSGPPSSNSFDFSKPTFSDSYDYKPPDYFNDKPSSKPSEYLNDKPIAKPPDYLGDKPISKPLSMNDYQDFDTNDKPPDSYKPDPHYDSHDHDSDYPDFPSDSSYNGDTPPKPIEYSGHLDHPPYSDDHDFHHEVIYDHIPEYHEHDHTEQPEMNDQRLDKRPYSYYYIGKKLWYVPLYFSIYFIIYIAALVLKSIARHKITFPNHLAEAVAHSRSNVDSSWWDLTGRVLEGVENFAEKYGLVT